MSDGPRGVRVIAHRDDALANRFSEFADGAGWSVERLTHEEAAIGTTVEVRDGGCRVFPDTSMFLRPPFRARAQDEDEQFLEVEELSLLWAAAALSRSAVVNRPGRHGLWGRGSISARVTEHRASMPRERSEVFCCGSARREWEGEWVAERRDGAAGVWPARGAGPVRARPVVAGEQYEAVTVVGSEAWQRSDEALPHLRMAERSKAAVRSLGLDFGTVWWAVAPRLDHAALVRVSCAPHLFDVGSRWGEIAPALLRLLS